MCQITPKDQIEVELERLLLAASNKGDNDAAVEYAAALNEYRRYFKIG